MSDHSNLSESVGRLYTRKYSGAGPPTYVGLGRCQHGPKCDICSRDNTTGLEWRTMPLTGSHLAKSIRVLTDFQSGVYVFSTKEAIRCFGAASQWLCEDEWFALANVPRHLIVQSWQWMDGVLPCGRPYKLAPIAPHRIPRDLVMIPSLDVFSLLIDREQLSEEEQDCWHAAAMRREHPSDEEQDSWHA
jgi:hypothetical protein